MPQKPEDTYFKKIGCSGKEITPNLLNQFGTTFCRMQKKARYDLDLPIINRPYYQAVLREVDLSDEQLQLIPKALDIFLQEEEGMPYAFIAHTNIKMLRLDQVKHHKKIAHIYKSLTKLSIDRFADIGMNDLGATLQEGNFIISHLYTTERDRPDQDPHTDYPYLSATKLKKNKTMADARLAWTAHMPITPDGMWITLYLSPGYGTPVHIGYGKLLLLRSDIVHGGGTPNLEYVTGKRFDRLHMYLDTEDQKADPGNIHSIWYDGITPLSELYWKPIKEFQSGKQASK